MKNHAWFSLLPDYVTCNMKVLNDPPRAITVMPEPTLEAPYIPPVDPAQPGAKPKPSCSIPTSIPDGGSHSSVDIATGDPLTDPL
jgi:hypothetical protein